MAKKRARRPADPVRLPAFHSESGSKGKDKKKQEKLVNAVIETPMGSRNKFKYDEELGMFALSKVLPMGMTFPAAFGFVPSTRADDGDPADILVLMDEPVWTGCVVPTRVIGVIEAEQKEKGEEAKRNDRLVGVAAESREHAKVRSVHDLARTAVEEIQQFFVNYNRETGKEFKVLDCKGPKPAMKLVRKSLRRAGRKAA